MNAAQDMRVEWARADLAEALKEIAKLRAKLAEANREIGGLQWELEQARKP